MQTELEKGTKSKIALMISIGIILLFILFAGVIWIVWNQKNNDLSSLNEVIVSTSEDENIDAEDEAFSISSEEINTEISTNNESDVTSHKEEALTDEHISLSDVYAPISSTVQLKCYYSTAESYLWEKYDIQKKQWKMLESENILDELYRNISSVSLQAPASVGSSVMVRCIVQTSDKRNVTETASIYSIGNIIDISVEEYIAAPYTWLSIYNIPVNVTFANGDIQQIIGLEGLTFVEKQEFKDISYNTAGNIVETVTVMRTECKYSYIELGQKELELHYRNGENLLKTDISVLGKDISPPEIISVDISEFDIKSVDEEVRVTISIQAIDSATPSPYLQYAFLLEGIEPSDDDWIGDAVFEKKINRNGIWIAYCKDQSGNISTFEKKIITVDQKPPVLKVTLLQNEWCTSNKIIVEAKDELPVTYFFSCNETGEESGWIDSNEYDVVQNGTWKVQAKDAVGNISIHQITINNIDTQMPIIREIAEGESK